MESQNEMILPKCVLCESNGRRSKMKFFAINLEYSILSCEDESCPYPIGFKDIVLVKTSNLVKYKEILKQKEQIANDHLDIFSSTLDRTTNISKENTFDKIHLSILKGDSDTVKFKDKEKFHRNIESNVNSIKELMVEKEERDTHIKNPKMLQKLQLIQRRKIVHNMLPKTPPKITNSNDNSNNDTNCALNNGELNDRTNSEVMDFNSQNNINQIVLPVINLSQDNDGSFKVNVEVNKNPDTNSNDKNETIDSLNTNSISNLENNQIDGLNQINGIIVDDQLNINSDTNIVENESNGNLQGHFSDSEIVTESQNMQNLSCLDLFKDLDLDNIDVDLNDDFIKSLLT